MNTSSLNYSMRVGVNLTPLVPGKSGGVVPYVDGILKALLNETDLSFTYFINGAFKHRYDDTSDRVRVVEVRDQLHKVIESRYRHGEFEVLFAPVMSPGIKYAFCPMVVLLVDLQHRSYPENFTIEDLHYRALNWEWPARAAQTLCVMSSYGANDACKFLGISKEKIIEVPPNLSSEFIEGESSGKLSPRVEKMLPSKYLLFPSNTWPHKNHIGLVNALALLRDSTPGIRLVFTGWKHNAHKELTSTIKKLNLEHEITWLGYLGQQEMPYLFRRARGLIFPSFFEGFGIPLIEAMASDCPIACSNRTSLPDVAGDSVIYFNPDSPDEIAGAMQKLWIDDNLCTTLVKKGRDRLLKIKENNGMWALADALQTASVKFNNPLRWSGVKLNKDKSLPLVSIIVPSFQQSKYLRECIDSILAQNYPNIEVLVIDGGSTDCSVEILRSYGNKIYWVSEADDGQADAVNKGLNRSRGEIIGWLNSDDIYKPDSIMAAVSALLGESGCWLVYGEADYIDANGLRTGRYPTDTFSITNLLNHCCICQPTVFFNRRLLNLAGNLNTDYDMALDYELWLRYSKYTPFLYLPISLAASRLYTDNKTAKYRSRSIKEAIQACKFHYQKTSLLWCRQLANDIASKLPLVASNRYLNILVQLLILIYTSVRHIGPYWVLRTTKLVSRILSRLMS